MGKNVSRGVNLNALIAQSKYCMLPDLLRLNVKKKCFSFFFLGTSSTFYTRKVFNHLVMPRLNEGEFNSGTNDSQLSAML